MKQIILILAFSITLLNCGGVKKTQEAINNGNYDQAIATSIKHLRNNKTKKSNQSYILILEEAFKKVTERELAKIDFLRKDGNAANLEKIYAIYLNLDNKQALIKPLLPLNILKEDRNATFRFNDYSNDLIATKNELSKYLLKSAKSTLLNATGKIDFRNAYNDLKYLDEINPNYGDTKNLMEDAHYRGIDFVLVTMRNDSDKVIPRRLEEDLMDFDTYGLNSFWTAYHNGRQNGISYDFSILINLRDIHISPEQVNEKQVTKEKRIKDGWEYLLDENDDQVKDSLGNKIKVTKFKTVHCKLKKVSQFKSIQIVGQIHYFDAHNNQLVKGFPLSSEFVFENNYANYQGDKNALDKKELNLLAQKYIQFPSNEQMLYDSGEDLKKKIKYIISRNKLPNR